MTGRTLYLPDELLSLESVRVGVKRAFSLYTKGVRDRVVKERLEKKWEPWHKPLLAEAARKLDAVKEEAKGETLTGRVAKGIKIFND